MMFAADGIHTTSHTEKNQRLLKYHPDVYQEFRPLYNFSRYARYDCMTFTRTSLPECFARLAVIEEKTDKYIRGRPASS